MLTPLLADLGGPEVLILVLVFVLVFGAKKLPEIARGSGQALRIFKEETTSLRTDDSPRATERESTPGSTPESARDHTP